eukprot:746150-Amphidinium_carterae.2
MEWVLKHTRPTNVAWGRASWLGTELLTLAGSVSHAAIALWKVRASMGLDNLEGVQSSELESVIDPTHLEYLRNVQYKGVNARCDQPEDLRTRFASKPHSSATEALNQVYAQIWKDVHKGRVLVTAQRAHEGRRTHSSPFAAVSKQNPDRSVSVNKRVVHDQRSANAQCPSAWHPPALQPRLLGIGR